MEIITVPYQMNSHQIFNQDYFGESLFVMYQPLLFYTDALASASSSERLMGRTLLSTLEYRFMKTLRSQNWTGYKFPELMENLDSSRIGIWNMELNELIRMIIILFSHISLWNLAGSFVLHFSSLSMTYSNFIKYISENRTETFTFSPYLIPLEFRHLLSILIFMVI